MLTSVVEIFVKTRESLRELEPPENRAASSNDEKNVEKVEETVTKNEFGPPSYPPPEIPPLAMLSSFSLSILNMFDDECLIIVPPQEERTVANTAKENTSMESLIIKPASPTLSSSSGSEVSSILEITRQDSNGKYHRVNYDSSKNSSSLSLFGKAKAMLNNTVKKQSSDQLAKEGGNDKKQAMLNSTVKKQSSDQPAKEGRSDKKLAKATEQSGSVPGHKRLRRTRRRISHGDKVGLTK